MFLRFSLLVCNLNHLPDLIWILISFSAPSFGLLPRSVKKQSHFHVLKYGHEYQDAGDDKGEQWTF